MSDAKPSDMDQAPAVEYGRRASVWGSREAVLASTPLGLQVAPLRRRYPRLPSSRVLHAAPSALFIYLALWLSPSLPAPALPLLVSSPCGSIRRVSSQPYFFYGNSSPAPPTSPSPTVQPHNVMTSKSRGKVPSIPEHLFSQYLVHRDIGGVGPFHLTLLPVSIVFRLSRGQ